MGKTNHNAVKCLAKMHRIYGRKEGRTCGECPHLWVFEQSKRWFKCGLVGGGITYDWRIRWPACGKVDDEDPHREHAVRGED